MCFIVGIGIPDGRFVIPTALPKFVNAQDSNSPSPRPSPPLTRGERAGSGGILHAQEFVNSGSAIGIIQGVGVREC